MRAPAAGGGRATSTRARSASSSPTPGRSRPSRRSPSRRWRRSRRCSTAIMARWRIPAAGVIAHSDIAPGRKADPGPKFDWRRLARGGRAVWAEGRGAPGLGGVRRGRDGGRLCRAGGDWAAVLAAARLRFRPWARAAEPEAEDTGALGAACACALTAARRRLDRRGRGWPDGRGRKVEESPDSREKWRRVTPARGDPRESATEIRPPAGLRTGRARVKRWGKSPPRRRQRRRHGKPRQEQGQIGIARGPARRPRVLPPERSGLAARSPSATAGREEWPSAAPHRSGPSQNPAYRPSARTRPADGNPRRLTRP